MSLRLLFFLVFIFFLSGHLHSQNPLFGTPKDTLVAEDTLIYQGEDQQYVVQADDVVMTETDERPGMRQKWIARLVDWQRDVKDQMAVWVDDFHAGDRAVLLSILLISVLFGLLHSLGPGHNKLVVFSYFISERPHFGKGLLLGNLIALVHAFSGIVVAVILFYGSQKISLLAFETSVANHITMYVSYGFIVLIGLFLLIQNGRKLIRPQASSEAGSQEIRRIWPVALAIGLVPCPATMIWVSFLLASGFSLFSLLAGFSVGVGMALSISFIALLSMLFNALIRRVFDGDQARMHRIVHFVALLGALIIISLGLLMIFSV